jgi:hypothetical protein
MQNQDAKITESTRIVDEGLSPVMSPQAFALWGSEDVAYISKVTVDGLSAWAVIAGDGTLLGTTTERETAFAAATQNDRTAVSTH